MRVLRVVTLNIWNRGGPWEERLAAIRAGIAELDADIVGLQEVLRPSEGEGLDQAKLIGEELGYHIAYGMASETGNIQFGNAALSKYPITRSEVFPLPPFEAADSRSLLFSELDTPFGAVPFFVTHLSWRFHEGHVREAQVKIIAERVKALAPISGFPLSSWVTSTRPPIRTRFAI